MFDNADQISSYSRAQAIPDGVLVDVTQTAREAGIRFPVALTRAVFGRCVAVPDGVAAQDETGRLWDLVFLFRCAVGRSRGGDTLSFDVLVRNDNRRPRQVRLKAVCGPGDDGEPVVTVMSPDED